MSLAVAIPVAISAIQALLKYRGKVDEILALKEASQEIPFHLPPAPVNFKEQRKDVLKFFASDEGRLALELRGETAEYNAFAADALGASLAMKTKYVQLYCDLSDTSPVVVGPEAEARSVKASSKMRLSYYVVASHRLSRNPALTRLLLASADTLLEVGGANAGLFLSNPKTQAVVSTLIDEFAGKRDFDDDSSEMLLKSMLRSVVVAAMEHPEVLPDRPAVSALLGALTDLREAKGDDFVASIMTMPGFQGLVGSYLTKIVEDPALMEGAGEFRPILSATLKDLGENFEKVFKDPKALFGVLEVAVTAATGQAPAILAREINGKPLMSAVLLAVLKEVETQGSQNKLFKSAANGELLSGLYQATLGAVTANAGALADEAKINVLTATLISSVAGVFAKKELSDVLSRQTLLDVAAKSLEVLSANSGALARNSAFTTALLAGVLSAGASAIEDGLSADDVAHVLDTAIVTATANLASVTIPVPLESLLTALGGQLSEKGVRSLLQPESRADVIISTLHAVSQNPKVWSQFGKADLVEPLMTAVFAGLASDPTSLLTGPVMVEAAQAVLEATARRGWALLNDKANADDLSKLIKMGLKMLDTELGQGVDARNVPTYLTSLVEAYLEEPIELASIAAKAFRDLHAETMKLI